jgi:glucose-1-phosphate cytidylyltransferase
MLELGDGGRVERFSEKPRSEGWVNAGYFVLDLRVLSYLDGDACTLEREPLERLAAEGELVAYRHEGFFYAMDTYREYKVLNELWERGETPWQVWGENRDGFLLAG